MGTHIFILFYFILFFIFMLYPHLRMFIDFRERKEEREREIPIGCLPYVP